MHMPTTQWVSFDFWLIYWYICHFLNRERYEPFTSQCDAAVMLIFFLIARDVMQLVQPISHSNSFSKWHWTYQQVTLQLQKPHKSKWQIKLGMLEVVIVISWGSQTILLGDGSLSLKGNSIEEHGFCCQLCLLTAGIPVSENWFFRGGFFILIWFFLPSL